MSGYSPNEVVQPGTAVLSGVAANQVVTKDFPITAGGSTHMVVKVTAASVTSVGTITAKLQTAIGGVYVDSKSVVISASGDFYIKLMAEVSGDQTYLPLLSSGRLVVTTTNAGDAATIASVMVLQEL